METNARGNVLNPKAKQARKAQRKAASTTIPSAGSATPAPVAPDYSNMYEVIFGLGNPVSFLQLRAFYGLV